MWVCTWSYRTVALVPDECHACRTHLHDTSCQRSSSTAATFCWLHSCSSQRLLPLVLLLTVSSNVSSVACHTIANAEVVKAHTTAERRQSFPHAFLPGCHSTTLVAYKHDHVVIARRHQMTDRTEHHSSGFHSAIDLAQMSSGLVTHTGQIVPRSFLKYGINSILLHDKFVSPKIYNSCTLYPEKVDP